MPREQDAPASRAPLYWALGVAGGCGCFVLLVAGSMLAALVLNRAQKPPPAAGAPEANPWPECDRIVRHILTTWDRDADGFEWVSRKESPGRVDIVVRYRTTTPHRVTMTLEAAYRISSDLLVETAAPREIARTGP
jgi:hypothetical protein